MHILAMIGLLLLVGIFFLAKWLLTAIGVIKPEPVIPSGVAIGGKLRRTIKRDSGWAERHIDAYDKQITLTDYSNGEVWRVLDYKPTIDNTYQFILLRVA